MLSKQVKGSVCKNLIWYNLKITPLGNIAKINSQQKMKSGKWTSKGNITAKI